MESAIKTASLVVSSDHLKLIGSILFTYPCAMVFSRLPNRPALKHWFSILYSSFITLVALQLTWGFIHAMTTCIASYFLMKYYQKPSAAWLNFWMVLSSLSLCHVYRQMLGNSGDDVLDFSGPFMIMTIKLTSFGFNVQDGRTKDLHALTDFNKQMKVDRFPSLVEFFGWILFFCGYLVGPPCEFADYQRFIHLQPLDAKGKKIDESRSPSTSNATSGALLRSIVSAMVLVVLSPVCNGEAMLKPSWQLLPFYKKLLFIQLVGTAARCKYYTVWSLADGACILSGIGYFGKDEHGRPRWDRMRNIRVRRCEMAQSIKELGDNWNIGVNRWLKHYVYLRVTPPNRSPGAKSSFVTFAVSALWHGFYPGYYVMFLSFAAFQMLARRLRRTLRPFMLTPDLNQPIRMRKKLYDIAGTLITMCLVNIVSVAFTVLHVAPLMRIWSSIYFIHYTSGLVLFIVWRCAYPFLSSRQKERADKAVFRPRQASTPTLIAKNMDVTDLAGVIDARDGSTTPSLKEE